MSLKVNLTFCIIFALWYSASAKIYIAQDTWNADMEKCGSGGFDSQTVNIGLNDPNVRDLQYHHFNKNTIIIAGGSFKLTTGSSDPIMLNELLLNEYKEDDGVKSYVASFPISGGADFANQKAWVWIKFAISQDGLRQLTNYVDAGSRGAVTCVSASSHINYIKFVIE